MGRALLERYVREDGDGGSVEARKKLTRQDDAANTADSQNQPAVVKFGKQNSGLQAWAINGSVSGLTFGGK